MSTIGPLECAQGCIDTCQPLFAGEPQAYADCLWGCQQNCPGGAPERTDYAGEDFCLGTTGLIRCTSRGVIEDAGEIVSGIAQVAGRAAGAAIAPILGQPQILLAIAVIVGVFVVVNRVFERGISPALR